MKRKDAFDIAKVVLSVFVVAIHAKLFPRVLTPLLRIAVPLFFMMSSYLFFSKMPDGKSAARAHLGKFLLRNLRLYAFWFVVLLPVTLKISHYFTRGIWQGLLKMLHQLLLYSTFPASWYIAALCTAMAIVFVLSRRLSNGILLAGSIPIYLLLCLFTNYYGAMAHIAGWEAFCRGYETVMASLCHNFMAAFLWIVLGKMMAQGQIKPGKAVSWTLLLGGFCLLVIEHLVVLRLAWPRQTDQYLFLPVVCVGAFSLLCQWTVQCRHGAFLRKMSTITYVLHSSAIIVADVVLVGLQGWKLSLAAFISALTICVVATVVIKALEKVPCFKWLKWAY